VSLSPGQRTSRSWSKPARPSPIPFGLRWQPTTSPQERPISVTLNGRITPSAFIDCARRDHSFTCDNALLFVWRTSLIVEQPVLPEIFDFSPLPPPCSCLPRSGVLLSALP